MLAWRNGDVEEPGAVFSIWFFVFGFLVFGGVRYSGAAAQGPAYEECFVRMVAGRNWLPAL